MDQRIRTTKRQPSIRSLSSNGNSLASTLRQTLPACNSVQGSTASLAFLVFPATWILPLAESKGGSKVRIPLSTPNKSLYINDLHRLNSSSVQYRPIRQPRSTETVHCTHETDRFSTVSSCINRLHSRQKQIWSYTGNRSSARTLRSPHHVGSWSSCPR
jgi:hypothetical protein